MEDICLVAALILTISRVKVPDNFHPFIHCGHCQCNVTSPLACQFWLGTQLLLPQIPELKSSLTFKFKLFHLNSLVPFFIAQCIVTHQFIFSFTHSFIHSSFEQILVE